MSSEELVKAFTSTNKDYEKLATERTVKKADRI